MFTFNISSKIYFGSGVSKDTGRIAADLGLEKVLCVYDPGIKAAGIAEQIMSSIEASGLTCSGYGAVIPNPDETSIEEAAEAARSTQVDGIVAVGGGSSIDTAKAVNILLTNPSPIRQYEGSDLVLLNTKPLIAIPTTAGTASEATDFTVVTDQARKKKIVIHGKNCCADIALLDPLLTIKLPPNVTAFTGMDALTHAIEAFLSKASSPISDHNALKGISLIYQNLEQAVKNGKEVEVRSNMLLGSLFAGFAFNSAVLGLVHAIAHPLSAHCGLPHGLANAAVLPYVMSYNAGDASVRKKYRQIAASMGIETAQDSDEEAASRVIKAVAELCKKVKIPPLRETGVAKEDFETIAIDALNEHSFQFNPRKANVQDVMAILKQAY